MFNSYELGQGILFHLFLIAYYFTFSIKENFAVMFALLFLVLLMACLEYKCTRAFISPMMLWIVFWLAIIVIGRVDLHYYIFTSDWGEMLHNVVVVNTWVFYITYKIFSHTKICVRTGSHSNNRNLLLVPKLSKYVIIIFFTIIAFYILNIIYKKNIPQLSGNVDYYRRDFVVTPFFSVINVLRVVYSVVPVAYKYETSIKTKRLVLGLTLFTTFLELLTGWRTYIFQELILLSSTGFLIANMRTGKERSKNFKRLVWLGIVAVFLIGYIFVTRGNVHGSSTEIAYYVFQMIYLYFAPSFLNIQTAMLSLTPKGYPLYTTEAIWSIIIPTSKMPGFENINQNIGAFNVSTYMLQPFADGGVFGTIIWTFLIAIVAARIYSNAANSKKLFDLTCLGLANIVVFNFHNGFFLRSSSVLVWLFISAYISRRCYTEGERLDGEIL